MNDSLKLVCTVLIRYFFGMLSELVHRSYYCCGLATDLSDRKGKVIIALVIECTGIADKAENVPLIILLCVQYMYVRLPNHYVRIKQCVSHIPICSINFVPTSTYNAFLFLFSLTMLPHSGFSQELANIGFIIQLLSVSFLQ